MLQLKCTGQEMRVAVDERIADKYINANKVHFEFCDRWAGMIITAQFTQKQKDEETGDLKDNTYDVVVDELTGTVTMPNEITAGEVFISAFGVDPVSGSRITSIPIKKTVDKSGFVGDGETPIPPTPDLYAQLLEKFGTGVPQGTGIYKQLVTDKDGAIVWDDRRIMAGEKQGAARTSLAAAEQLGGYKIGYAAFAEGLETEASGQAAHSEGFGTEAIGKNSHTEGNRTIAGGENQHVQGTYNVKDTANRYAHIVGNGAMDTKRSNAHTLDWDGNAWFKGKVFVGGTSMDDATELGTGGGTGLPAPAGANMQLVTDSDGNWSQAERLAYPITGTVEILPESEAVENQGEFGITTPLNGVVSIGKKYTVTYNGVCFECSAVGFEIDEGVFFPMLGNASALGGDDTGEPFTLIIVPSEHAELFGGASVVVTVTDAPEKVVLAITNEDTTYKKVSFDYLPEGVGGIEYGVVLPEVTLTAGEDMGGGMAVFDPLNMPIIIGRQYTVLWNGTEYKCVAQAFNLEGMSVPALGDVGAATGGASTGEPFAIVDCIMLGAGVTLMVMPLDGSATATLSISGETIKKIDPKYLDLEWIPEMQGVGEEIVPTTTKLSGSGANTLPSEAAEKMTVGTNIVVYVKDKRYVCTISDINGNRMAGNLSMLLEGYPDTGEPFYIWIRDDGSQIIFETSDVWWYAIYAVGNSQQIPRKLPSEYVPDMSAFYVNALIGDFNAESGSDKNTANKTYSEIMAAYEMNRPVFCRVDGEIVLSLVHITDNTRDISFGGLYKGVERIVTFTSGGLIKTYYQRYAPAT